MNRKEKTEALRIKLLRKQLCQKWLLQGITVNEDSFISVENTLHLQNLVINKINNFYTDKCIINKSYPEKDIDIQGIYIKHLNEYIEFDKQYVFYEKMATRIGAMLLQGKTITDNKEFIYHESELYDNCCSLFIFSEDLKNGCCLWESEYCYEIYKW